MRKILFLFTSLLLIFGTGFQIINPYPEVVETTCSQAYFFWGIAEPPVSDFPPNLQGVAYVDNYDNPYNIVYVGNGRFELAYPFDSDQILYAQIYTVSGRVSVINLPMSIECSPSSVFLPSIVLNY